MTSKNKNHHNQRASWSTVRIHTGFLCIGAMTFLLIQHKSPAGIRSMTQEKASPFGPAQPRSTIEGTVNQTDGQMTMFAHPSIRSIKIHRLEYCKQVAMAVLIQSNHEIDSDEVRFIRDPRLPGNAVQQFAEAFGYAIDSGLGKIQPDLESEAKYRSDSPVFNTTARDNKNVNQSDKGSGL
jgi:hypothetical protein